MTPEADRRFYWIDASFDPREIVGRPGEFDIGSYWTLSEEGNDGWSAGFGAVGWGSDNALCHGPFDVHPRDEVDDGGVGAACGARGSWVLVQNDAQVEVPEPAAATLLLIGLLGVGAASVLRHAPQSAQRST